MDNNEDKGEMRKEDIKEKIRIGKCLSAMSKTEGWKLVENWILTNIDKLSNIKNVIDGDNNKVLVALRKHQTAIGIYEGVLKNVENSIKQGEVLEKRFTEVK